MTIKREDGHNGHLLAIWSSGITPFDKEEIAKKASLLITGGKD
ncbi:hypothetical protein JOE49_000918 [Paenibacillus sp. PvR133]|nr:hypothetical protein [Paenibacillus sp. PvR133]